MRELVFAMELKGKAAAEAGAENKLKAQLTGKNAQGETVVFESEVILNGQTFDEIGVIDYRGHGKLKFETVGSGYLGSSPMAGLQAGIVCWRITSGEGEYAGATGHITSNFVVSADGDVVDNQYVRIFLP